MSWSSWRFDSNLCLSVQLVFSPKQIVHQNYVWAVWLVFIFSKYCITLTVGCHSYLDVLSPVITLHNITTEALSDE